ncbi:type II toxin-antitoxin system HicA family toxin [Fibrella aquatilis]|uniref:Type II toxin-antitoxin system HicA family toxin n=1 Tax=Fibrella aquatilis TaxID=2817059 RepID=A0A939G068_9BACT|nr:type II toxin-antitoxin system HicA family toxin [Fibrella aquatilis]MBO0929539.1 type II toxin-antitoxin system HicA family toxin [Fibrella aquatilis]
MTVREVLRILHEDGWMDKTQKGSHLQLVHSTKLGKVTVPMHKGDIPPGTLHSILRQAGLK